MLIIKAFINDREIDQINILNTGIQDKIGRYIYNVYTSLDNDSKLKRKFYHYREQGWKPLVSQILKHMITLEDK